MPVIGGCFLLFDGIIAVLFFLLFNWLGLRTIGLVGGIIIGIPVIIWIIKECIREVQEEKRENRMNRQREKVTLEREREIDRRNSFYAFNEGISEEEFRLMAFRVANRIRRLNIIVDGPRIKGFVESQSGISTWEFIIDFNDYGHITGNWWITYRENIDSNIPNRFADLMENEIKQAI